MENLHLNVLQRIGNGSKSRQLLTVCIIYRLPRSRRLALSVCCGQTSVGLVFSSFLLPRMIPTIAFVSLRDLER